MAKKSKKAKEILCDVVFLSSSYGLNHERVLLSEKDMKNHKKVVKKVFDEEAYHPDRGDMLLIKPVHPEGYVLCDVVYEHRHGDDTTRCYLPENFSDLPDSASRIVEKVFESDFEEDRAEFLTITRVEGDASFPKVIDL